VPSMPGNEPLYGLSSKDPWIHFFRLPEELWQSYCGAKIDWKIEGPESSAKFCGYCQVLKELEDAANTASDATTI